MHATASMEPETRIHVGRSSGPTPKSMAENNREIANAPDQQTAEMIVATLEAAGIPALLQHDTIGPAEGLLPHLGLAWNRGVAVPADREQEALALLQSIEASEDELVAEEEDDPTTLEEAEARVRNA